MQNAYSLAVALTALLAPRCYCGRGSAQRRMRQTRPSFRRALPFLSGDTVGNTVHATGNGRGSRRRGCGFGGRRGQNRLVRADTARQRTVRFYCRGTRNLY